MGVASDILGYFARPNGVFFPGFTLNALIIGLIYGFFFYKKPITLKRVILASLMSTIIINLILTPLWLNMMYGNAFGVLVAGRIIKNVVMFPIDTALLMTVLKLVEKIKQNRKMR
jgi:ECF transporter S component (folate family)